MQVWAVTLRQRDKLKSNSNSRTRAKRNQGAATVFKAPRWSVNCTYGMYVLVYVHVGMYIWRKNERLFMCDTCVTNWRSSEAQKIVCSSHQIYMTWLPRRSVRKQRVQMVTVGFILVVFVQRVCGWAGFGISLLWFRRLLVLLFLACRRFDSTSAGFCVLGRS